MWHALRGDQSKDSCSQQHKRNSEAWCPFLRKASTFGDASWRNNIRGRGRTTNVPGWTSNRKDDPPYSGKDAWYQVPEKVLKREIESRRVADPTCSKSMAIEVMLITERNDELHHQEKCRKQR